MYKVIVVNTLGIILATATAILLHALFPAPASVEDFDSLLVKLFGFPAVATSYFLVLFIHCTVVMRYFGKHSSVSELQVGFRFGVAFAVIYLLGMQEVVVDASPYGEWGMPFIQYQLFMGLADAIPVLVLCVLVAYLTLGNANIFGFVNTMTGTVKMKTIVLITVLFTAQRAIGYETGIVFSNCDIYPIPCYLWTVLFGLVLGWAYVLLYPIFSQEQNRLLLSIKLAILTIGVNWIIFNSFIGLLFSGAMPQMLLRSGLDTAMLFLSSLVITKFFIKS